MKEGRKPEYPEKTPGDELQKMPHTIHNITCIPNFPNDSLWRQ